MIPIPTEFLEANRAFLLLAVAEERASLQRLYADLERSGSDERVLTIRKLIDDGTRNLCLLMDAARGGLL